mmetsp:Transcript_7619/g.31531  ORF Transcript_7619/g.31531 Transcript_7619/m.31531 type:complete len:314 (+) Transcript_7619:786-1727(+)
MHSPQLRFNWLLFAYVSQLITVYCVVLMTYTLVRLEPQPHALLLNAVALDYIATFDMHLVKIFEGQPRLRRLLTETKETLAVVADKLVHGGTLYGIRKLKAQPIGALLWAPRDEMTFFRRLEVVQRLTKELFNFFVFALCILAGTGGHIAHSHIGNVLWFLCLVPDKSKPESQRYPLNRIRARDQSKLDRDYYPRAALILVFGFLLFHLGLALVRHHSKLVAGRQSAATMLRTSVDKLKSTANRPPGQGGPSASSRTGAGAPGVVVAVCSGADEDTSKEPDEDDDVVGALVYPEDDDDDDDDQDVGPPEGSSA